MDVRGAVLGRLEDHRVDEANERRVGDAVVYLEVVGFLFFCLHLQLLCDRGSGAEGLGGTCEAADLGEDVVARGDTDVERMAGREPKLVDALDVAGIGDSDSQRSVVEGVRDRDDALEDVDGDLAARVVRHTGEGEVDERHLEACRERSGQALARGHVLIDEGGGERAHARRAADARQLVGGYEARGGDQIRDELRERVDRRRGAADTTAAERRGGSGLGARSAKFGRAVGVHISLVRGIGRSRPCLDPAPPQPHPSRGRYRP